ncbi:hypothetical protein BC826DRAFT_381023 [Russula brevipes]|nr:hypothetical protein BC826DRAFT_381023 [Russula brevipes]
MTNIKHHATSWTAFNDGTQARMTMTSTPTHIKLLQTDGMHVLSHEGAMRLCNRHTEAVSCMMQHSSPASIPVIEAWFCAVNDATFSIERKTRKPTNLQQSQSSLAPRNGVILFELRRLLIFLQSPRRSETPIYPTLRLPLPDASERRNRSLSSIIRAVVQLTHDAIAPGTVQLRMQKNHVVRTLLGVPGERGLGTALFTERYFYGLDNLECRWGRSMGLYVPTWTDADVTGESGACTRHSLTPLFSVCSFWQDSQKDS